MDQSRQDVFRAVFNLPLEEKLDLVQDLWDDIVTNPDNVPIFESHIDELDRRGAMSDANPKATMTWVESVRKTRNRRP